MNRTEIKLILKKIIALFMEGNYKTLFMLDREKGIAPEILQKIVQDYRGVLTMPPEKELNDFHLFEDEDEELSTDHFIEFDFWFDNKPSDLTLKVTIYDNGNFEIRDIRIL